MAAAASIVDGVFAGSLRLVLCHKMTDRKISSWLHRSSTSVVFPVSRSSFKINTSLTSKDYFELSKELMENDDGAGGPPRWFSPLECGCRLTGSPLLLYLPGIDGVGFGLMLQHKRLGEIFDIWCLHIPIVDRTSLADLAMLVQSTIKTEHDRAPMKPIYIVGESHGASLALIVAAQNPDIDLVLILANPATNFSKSLLQSVVPLSDMLHKQLQVGLLHGMSSIPVETVLWKLKKIDEMQYYLNSHIHAVKAQTLILSSGKDLVLSSITEGEKLRSVLKNCQIRTFVSNDDRLFLDDNFDLAAAIKCNSYYRRGKSADYVSDFLPPKPSELKAIYESFIRWVDVAVDPVVCSTFGGKIVRGLAGIPLEGPVLLVSNHMMLAMDAVPLLSKFWIENNIMLRGMAHPIFFERFKDGKLQETPMFDVIRMTGGVPASAKNLYRLLSLKSHVVLYPGGVREAFHHKNEEYKLIWPDEPEFVRMAANFGATIIPFGSVGEDDVQQLLLDCDDQMKIPPLKALIEELTSEAVRLRTDAEGEIGKQFLYCPVCLPKLPGRFYFLFGNPISTEGRKDVLRNKDKAREMYLEVQTEIEKCVAYLKEKREKDPYRSLLARLPYQASHGSNSQVPTFDI